MRTGSEQPESNWLIAGKRNNVSISTENAQ